MEVLQDVGNHRYRLFLTGTEVYCYFVKSGMSEVIYDNNVIQRNVSNYAIHI